MERLVLSPRMEILSEKQDFLKGRPRGHLPKRPGKKWNTRFFAAFHWTFSEINGTSLLSFHSGRFKCGLAL